MDSGCCLHCLGDLLIARYLFSPLNDWEQLVCMPVTSHPPPEQQATHIPLNTWGGLRPSSISTLFTPNHSKMWPPFYFVLVLSMGLNIGLALGFALGFWVRSLYSAWLFLKPLNQALLRAVSEAMSRKPYRHALPLLSSPGPQQKALPQKAQSPGSLMRPFSRPVNSIPPHHP